MQPWPTGGSKTHVAHMTEGDYYGSEKSVIMEGADEVGFNNTSVEFRVR